MDKRRTLAQLIGECDAWRAAGKRIVWTNGCFDLFHAGHVRALEEAASLGDKLVVGMNSDVSVRALKAAGRPLCEEADRAAVLSAMAAVDRVLVFDNLRCDRELAALRPDIWAKAGDYTPASLDPAERGAVEAYGGRIVITPLIPGISTTLLVKKIRRHDPEKIVSAACALVRDGDGRQLMVATRYADGRKWSLPGGGQNHGETLPETARRETFEETGLEVAIGRHITVIERREPSQGLHLVLHVFAAEPLRMADIDGAIPLRGGDEYVEETAWFSPRRMREEREIILGRRLWLELDADPRRWPPYHLLREGEE